MRHVFYPVFFYLLLTSLAGCRLVDNSIRGHISDNSTGSDDGIEVTPTSDSIKLDSLSTSNVTALGFDISADFIGDANTNAVITIYYCSDTDASGCDPLTGASTTLQLEGSSYVGDFEALPTPYDPGDVLNILISASDVDGVGGDPLTTQVTLQALATASKSLAFNGASEDLVMNRTTSIDANSGSFSMWFRHSSTNEVLLSHASAAGNVLYINNSTTIELHCGSGGFSFVFASSLVFANWYHLAVTLSGGDARVFINGVESTSGARPVGGSCQFEQIGVYYDNTARFSGRMKSLAIWDATLDPAEVTTLYNGGALLPTLRSLGLTGSLTHWWRMGDGIEAGAGYHAYDMGGSGDPVWLILSEMDPTTAFVVDTP